MNRTELRDALRGLYNHTDDPRLIEEIRKAVEKITGASAPATEANLHGPFAYLVIVSGLDEEHWSTSDDPETMSGYVSLPMFTRVDPFTYLPDASPNPAPVVADRSQAALKAIAAGRFRNARGHSQRYCREELIQIARHVLGEQVSYAAEPRFLLASEIEAGA